MHKKVTGTAAALLLSLCIAAGGLCILRVGLEKEEKSILSQSGTVEQQEKSREVGYTESDASLSEEELYQVLENDEDSEMLYPHEPYYGQLPMDEAVERGEEWIEKLKKESGLFPSGWKGLGNKVSANLSRPGKEEEMILDSNRIFSSWNLDFYGEDISVSMEMNAVTGQLLSLQFLHTYKGDKNFEIRNQDREKLMEFFVSQFELKADGEIEKEEGQLVQSLGKGQIYAVEEFYVSDIDSYGAVSRQDTLSDGVVAYEKDSYGINTYTIDCYLTLQKPVL